MIEDDIENFNRLVQGWKELDKHLFDEDLNKIYQNIQTRKKELVQKMLDMGGYQN